MDSIENIREQLRGATNDLQLNLQAVLNDGSLAPKQRYAVALAVAFHEGNQRLRAALLAEGSAVLEEATIEDARAAAALMAMNNVLYRFRHQIGKEVYQQRPARLRMNRIVKPSGDHVTFELLCLAVSAVNGCEACVRAHEKTVIEKGMTEEQVFDAVRIASVVRAVSVALAF